MNQPEPQEALAWIRKKLGLPEDAQMFTGQETIAGRLHVWGARQHGYMTYIEAFKCDDKQGEIARLTVRAERAESDLYVARNRIAELEGDFVADVKALVKKLKSDGHELAHALARVERHLSAYPAPQPVADTGVELIAAERRRQTAVEGWTPEHDAEHIMGEMVTAAMCYGMCASFQARGQATPTGLVAARWPWESSWWKPSVDPIRNLVKSGALIAAEIDRLKRLSAPSSPAAANPTMHELAEGLRLKAEAEEPK